MQCFQHEYKSLIPLFLPFSIIYDSVCVCCLDADFFVCVFSASSFLLSIFIYISIYIKISCLSVCLSSDVMFVCRLTSCLSTDEITDQDIGTQMTTGTSINIKISCLCICRVTSCLCVDWHHVCRLTKLQTGTSGHK